MTDQHRATPEQWADAGAFASDTRSCLFELRARAAIREVAAWLAEGQGDSGAWRAAAVDLVKEANR